MNQMRFCSKARLGPHVKSWWAKGSAIQSHSLLGDPLHLSAQGAEQFNLRLKSFLGPDAVNLSADFPVASAQGGSRS